MRPILMLVLTFATVGCGTRSEPQSGVSDLSFEEIETRRDTTGLSRGVAPLKQFSASRGPAGGVVARGELQFPDSTLVTVTLSRAGERHALAQAQAVIRRGRFVTAPIFGSEGPLATGNYRMEITALFDAGIQPEIVMRSTRDGQNLRGPGITRDRFGVPAYHHEQELTL
ncbi:MAG: hypothetical protein HOP12_13020 [Candidatus Eisenbacteria bacterium]|uniref:Lipoprotein n=1 Tax=Eiseniibacteriota bacterium TaxID=2212470 RepID=A0A849SKE8_UNCEI|nr:hypothetical protein [Candidatus Eisenbacteria bacterium]